MSCNLQENKSANIDKTTITQEQTNTILTFKQRKVPISHAQIITMIINRIVEAITSFFPRLSTKMVPLNVIAVGAITPETLQAI